MQNRYLEKFSSQVEVKIEGKNINKFIKRIIQNKINIIKLTPISYKEANLIINIQDYQKLLKIKTIYKINIIKKYGISKVKYDIKQNLILILVLIIGLFLIIFLSKITFSIDIIHENQEIRALIKEELTKRGIKKYHFKKSYQEIEKIEKKILEANKDKLEWIEIIETGTKYIIRIEERKINNTPKKHTYQSIISNKNAIITEINATSGEKVKEINDYVKKGETIISGYITHPDSTTTTTIAKGTVYGEVWYKVTLDYPYIYQEEKLTGKSKTIYAINFLNKRISLFDFNKYKTFINKDKIIISSPILNINLTKEKQYELIVKDEVYPIDIAITSAKAYITKKLKKDNPNIKQVNKIVILTKKEEESKLKLKLFITVTEKISTSTPINEITEERIP